MRFSKQHQVIFLLYINKKIYFNTVWYASSPKACARRRAIESVVANSACPNEAAAERAVNEVWESCFNDTRPFDEVRMDSEPPRVSHDA